MSHKKRDIENVKVGDTIFILNNDHFHVVDQIHKRYFRCFTPGLDEEGEQLINPAAYSETDDMWLMDHVIIDKDLYDYTAAYSPDGLEYGKEDPDVWSDCEIHYGISHLGSQDPDPVRQLAFKILKDDPVARDIALDVIARGV